MDIRMTLFLVVLHKRNGLAFIFRNLHWSQALFALRDFARMGPVDAGRFSGDGFMVQGRLHSREQAWGGGGIYK